jgi:hypothetical protein
VTRPRPLALVQWLLGPLLVAALAGELGSLRAKAQRGRLFVQTSALAPAESKRLESLPARAMDNAVWPLSGAEVAQKLVKFELDQTDERDGARRARLLIRFGLIDRNFDGQAAVFAAACTADASLCEPIPLRDAAEHEAGLRFVAPGNHLPLALIGGHPPIGAP